MLANFRATGRSTGHVATFDWTLPPNRNVKLMKGDQDTPRPLTSDGFYIDPRQLDLELRAKMIVAALEEYHAQV